MAFVADDTNQKTSVGSSASPKLNLAEAEMVELFVNLSKVLGQPKSIAEIYGVLFVSEQPLNMEDLMDRLLLSKGSASQGLKYLRALGAVKSVYVPGDRRDHYVAVAELRELLNRLLRDHVAPHLDSGLQRLDHIEGLVEELPSEDKDRFLRRINLLRSWAKNGKQFLPIVVKVLGK